MQRGHFGLAMFLTLLLAGLATAEPLESSARRRARTDSDTLALSALLEIKLDTRDFQRSMSLKEFLNLLVKKVAPLELPIFVDAKAFKNENPDAPHIHDTPVELSPVPKVRRLGVLLRQALRRVNPPNATFILRDGAIEITTIERAQSVSVLGRLIGTNHEAIALVASVPLDPKIPLADLLPSPPKAAPRPPLFDEDLAKVPEMNLEAMPELDVVAGDPLTVFRTHIDGRIAKIRRLNADSPDGFVKALRDKRADLRGLPFRVGDGCRQSADDAKLFALQAALVRACISELVEGSEPAFWPVKAEAFWAQYRSRNEEIKDELMELTGCSAEAYDAGAVAALMQILGPESPAMRRGLVKYLSGMLHADATRALTRLALFAPEDDVRRPAVNALQLRRERDYNAILLDAFRYPLPVIARRAAEAVIRLERTDLLPELVALLDEPDPRLPVVHDIDGKRTSVVREVVRINHLRNCLLCHEPFTGGVVDTFQALSFAAIPLPNGTMALGYSGPSPSGFVRIDVIYLRQDFSLMQPVHDPEKFTKMHRYDYLVRKRTVTADEVAEYQRQEPATRAGGVTTYQRAVLSALRELTGRDAAPTSRAWQDLLGLRHTLPKFVR